MQKEEQSFPAAKTPKIATTPSIKSEMGTTAQLSVSSTPEVKVTLITSTDVFAVAGIALTACIVIATTVLTIKNFRISTKSQETIATNRDKTELEKAKAETLSRNRQEWINTLRNSIADYISTVLAIEDLFALKMGLDPNQTHLTADQIVANGREWSYKLHLGKTEAQRLKAKICLLTNPAEDQFIKLITLVNELYVAAINKASDLEEKTAKLTEISQNFLKKEWERVKEFR